MKIKTNFTINRKDLWSKAVWIFIAKSDIRITVRTVDAHISNDTQEVRYNNTVDQLSKNNATRYRIKQEQIPRTRFKRENDAWRQISPDIKLEMFIYEQPLLLYRKMELSGTHGLKTLFG